MSCKNSNKKIVSLRKASTKIKNLNENGRLQFFYHSPSSELPIRDVMGEQGHTCKTEPHIEIGAENYWSGCYQKNNIIPFINNNEKYLFLMTRCRNESLEQFNGEKFVVGYISRKSHGKRKNGQFYIKGDTFLYSFEDAIPVIKFWNPNIRVQKVDEALTKKILNHFKNRKNILQDCIMEIKRLDKNNVTCFGKECGFKTECLRRNL